MHYNRRSICIPKMDVNISVRSILQKLGKIINIVEIPLRNDDLHKRIIINICWYNTSVSKQIEYNLTQSGSVNLVYDEPWFWKIYIAK